VKRPHPARRKPAPKPAACNALPCRWRRTYLRSLLFGTLGCTLGLHSILHAQDVVTEPEFKAALIVKLVRFIVWPDSAFASPTAPLHIGVLGKHPFDHHLDRLAEGKNFEKHPFLIRYSHSQLDLKDCQFVYVSKDRTPALKDIVQSFSGRPTLLVGEELGFASNGGMINVIVKDQKPHLQINARTSEVAGLRFRGQLAQTRNIEWIERPSAESK